MNKRDLGRLHKTIRQRARLTQEEVARLARIGRWKVVQLEANDLDHLTLDEIDRSFGALDARLYVSVSYHGAELDRLLDQAHAELVAAVVRVLRDLGWEVRVEVTFNEYGDRGSIDVLGWLAEKRALLIVEVKSELASIEGTLRPLAMKCRVGPKVAGDQFGWKPVVVGRVLVLPEASTARRAVEKYSAALDTVLPSRSRAIRSWLRAPAGPIGGIWFLSEVGGADASRNPSAVRRVRKPKPRSADASNVPPTNK